MQAKKNGIGADSSKWLKKGSQKEIHNNTRFRLRSRRLSYGYMHARSQILLIQGTFSSKDGDGGFLGLSLCEISPLEALDRM